MGQRLLILGIINGHHPSWNPRTTGGVVPTIHSDALLVDSVGFFELYLILRARVVGACRDIVGGAYEELNLLPLATGYQPTAAPSVRGSEPAVRTPVSGSRLITCPPPNIMRW